MNAALVIELNKNRDDFIQALTRRFKGFSPDIIEDSIQTALLKIFKYRKLIRNPPSFLYSIASRALLDYKKRPVNNSVRLPAAPYSPSKPNSYLIDAMQSYINVDDYEFLYDCMENSNNLRVVADRYGMKYTTYVCRKRDHLIRKYREKLNPA